MTTHKLLTEEIKRKLRQYPLYSTECEGKDMLDNKCLVKFFGGSAATWLITEAQEQEDGDWLFYGLATLGHPSQIHPGDLLWEWGYVTLKQLQEVKFPPFGLPIERDMYLSGDATVRDEVFMFGGAE